MSCKRWRDSPPLSDHAPASVRASLVTPEFSCIVAYAPNLSGNGNALIVEGTAMAGTEAAWDFVSDDTALLPFLKKIQHADGRVPYFELLLGTQSMGASAVHSSLIAWRTHN